MKINRLLTAAVAVAALVLAPIPALANNDNNENAAKVSLYGKNSAAGDTPVLLDSSGNVKTVLTAGSAAIGSVKLLDTGGANVGSISAAGALKVDNSAVTQPVSGTFWQATQPISGTVTAQASGTFTVDGSGVTQPVSGTFWQATQPVSGTVTVSQGDATASSGAWPIKLIDSAGTNAAAISAGGALTVDGSGVTQPVSGTVTADAGTGTFLSAPTANTDGGASAFFNATTGDKTQISALAANLYSIYADNSGNGAISYIQLFATASAAVTLGVTSPDWVISIPGTSSIAVSLPMPWSASQGLTIATTTTTTGSSTASVAVSALYKD